MDSDEDMHDTNDLESLDDDYYSGGPEDAAMNYYSDYDQDADDYFNEADDPKRLESRHPEPSATHQTPEALSQSASSPFFPPHPPRPPLPPPTKLQIPAVLLIRDPASLPIRHPAALLSSRDHHRVEPASSSPNLDELAEPASHSPMEQSQSNSQPQDNAAQNSQTGSSRVFHSEV
ncbi:hypothetical protein Ahy_B01g056837 [Arachis hypogaea]|uniref:Uncharacterized protein n=1 Tax=Arachis hypogaea TaxID=3818 RepID=A0A445AZN8_ARAHY|nr:hypothetical protein Ahy_B01g056837 [Arachis hypogaea]